MGKGYELVANEHWILMKLADGNSHTVAQISVEHWLGAVGLVEISDKGVWSGRQAKFLGPGLKCSPRVDYFTSVGWLAHCYKNRCQVPVGNRNTHADLARLGSEEIFSPRRVLYTIEKKDKSTVSFTLGSIVNGGMIAGVVDQATSLALQRDLQSGNSAGLCRNDIPAAVDAIEAQNRDLNFTDELAEFVHDFRDDVVGIQKLRQKSS